MRGSFAAFGLFLLYPPLVTPETAECVADVDGSTTCTPVSNNDENSGIDTAQGYLRPQFCQDLLEDCQDRMKNATCVENFVFMAENCAKSCQICSPFDPSPKTIATHGRGTAQRIFATEPQVIEGYTSIETWLHLRGTENYMYDIVYQKEEFADVRDDCLDRHKHCTYWAATGECINNERFMITNCAPACHTCQMIKFENRCPLDQSGPSALAKPGQLDDMFTHILTDPQFAVYKPKALSRPSLESDEPWLIRLDNFLTAEECETFIELAAARGYKQSGEVDASSSVSYDGKREVKRSKHRTSSTTWCKGECAEHPVSKAVHDRLEALTGVPTQNYEPLQMLKYNVGEKYDIHHDYLDYHMERSPGARMLTVYFYLNDVPAGGGTHFPSVQNGLTVAPKRGSIVIWPSVLDGRTGERDERTGHAALPVEEGIKHGMNAWIHQRDFKTPHSLGCT